MALGGALGLVLVAPNTAVLFLRDMAQSYIQLGFAWQAWYNLISASVLRGRCGTISHPPSFCVAGMALMALGGALGRNFIARDGRRGIHGTGWRAWAGFGRP